ncbi:inositol 2-dehydrogenase [Labrys wisconsinensis]|uniref:Myo-inositol 2-dehydrogenase/D-chiro-inositol 1-dehydrogenase n=1 Tax=Labrys wisconsinensis TaxID=425677 RepID=A0ABU0JI90_9HYPH|nr:inositol 2-dehydrogenase [Labrys wisconsinensis]MDQ0474009.1 myo-inositol 2-dehydrogenase/D-chiro-inositol 1-dehydrogenase [Labrys wisconsinensis]
MLTLALFGAGRIGRIHARSIARHPRARLSHVVDPDGAAAAAVAAEAGGVPADAEAVFADPAVDAVVIASTAETHGTLIERAAASGKAIFCEKPIDRSTERTRAAIRTLRRAGTSLFLGFQRRFDPSFAALQQRLAAGEIGRPELVVLTSRDPAPPPIPYIEHSGGLFRESMVHDFDVARWLLGEEPTEVYATGSCLVDPRIAAVGSPDTAAVTLKTAGGAICVITLSWRAAYGYDQRAEVLGSAGMLRLDNRQATSVVKADAASIAGDRPLPFFLERYAEAYEAELDAFVTALESGTPFRPNEEDGLRALILADCAEQSARAGLPVAVPGELEVGS